jgi:hypothetical protein
VQGYQKIHAAKVRVARRKLQRKRARWGGKIIIRGSGKGGGHQCTAPRRTYMNASRMRSHG